MSVRGLTVGSGVYERNEAPRLSTGVRVDLRRTQWLFIALCFYLLSQGYTIPILPVGPWAIWPGLPEFAVVFLVLAFLIQGRDALAPSKAQRNVLLGCVCFVGLSFVSYLCYIAFLRDYGAMGVRFGAFQLYMLLQFVVVFLITTRIPLTPARTAILRRIVGGVLVFVSVSIIVTYFAIVPLKALAPHLPSSPAVAGPWWLYSIARGRGSGWGTIGYNHAYVALQVIMLAGLRLHLSLERPSFSEGLLLLLAMFACFLSGSRAGMAAIALFAMTYWAKRPSYVVLLALVVVSLVPLAAPDLFSVPSSVKASLERQRTLLNASDPESLSGRVDIWKQRLGFLNERPTRWVFGSGFGAAVDSGNNAHMLGLHIIVEMGLIGLLVFVMWFSIILYHLYQQEPDLRPVFWITVTFLFSSLTQETFYPDTSLGHFFGLYLCSVAIALRKPVDEGGS